ncbi:transporter [Halpernia frigidisoli]|uniref:Putative MetA-pathway of phenol degradation n=1 Tax=Halpernia frigidisoli TaxID=1125876 RepID=A0A1I3DF32_9FLAO|nr:transporter [Halpernia frigidisoli]SFH85392.1 Putative MetA-pathway of phenol degradation [Halpernia frigidisoli]
MKFKILIFTFLPLIFFAQMKTDRPGFATATDIVSKGNLQSENGLNYLHDNDEFSSDHLFRYGVAKDFELRLETNQNYDDAENSTYTFSGKYNFLNGSDSSPALTFIGISDFKIENYSAFLAANQSLSDKFNLQINSGYKKEDHFNYLFMITNLGYSISDKWSLFAEYYGNYTAKDSPDHNADFGLSYTPSNRLEFDISAGSSLDNISKNYFINAGFSFALFK